MTSVVEDQSAISDLTAVTLDDNIYSGGTQTMTSSGTVDVLNYQVRFASPGQQFGRVSLTLDRDGTITRVVDTANIDTPTTEQIDESSFTYGRQTVRLPSTRAQITRPSLLPACLAILTRADVATLATSTASTANKATAGRVSAASLRSTVKANELPEYNPGEEITVSRIADGVEIVGRYHLLPHPTVWTVIVRHGTADAHEVR